MDTDDKKSFWRYLIVIDKNDPRPIVPKRFGMGYTINFGSSLGRMLFVIFIIAIVGFIFLRQHKII